MKYLRSYLYLGSHGRALKIVLANPHGPFYTFNLYLRRVYTQSSLSYFTLVLRVYESPHRFPPSSHPRARPQLLPDQGPRFPHDLLAEPPCHTRPVLPRPPVRLERHAVDQHGGDGLGLRLQIQTNVVVVA